MHLPDEELIRAAAELLGVAIDAITPRLGALEQRHARGARVARRSRPLHVAAVGARGGGPGARRCSRSWSRRPRAGSRSIVDAAIHAFEAVTGLALAGQQRRAVEAALTDKCVVITGGPGVGKTTIVKAIVHLAQAHATAGSRSRHRPGAPPSGSARRPAHEAMTIHRLLEYQPHENGFAQEPREPARRRRARRSTRRRWSTRSCSARSWPRSGRATQLVLVGDVDQLPSVGAGAVLADVIASGRGDGDPADRDLPAGSGEQDRRLRAPINHGELPDLDTPAGAQSTSTSSAARIPRPRARRSSSWSPSASRRGSASMRSPTSRCSRRCTAASSAPPRSTARCRRG